MNDGETRRDHDLTEDSINVMLFREIAQKIGASTIRELTERSDLEQDAGHEGAHLVDEDEDWTLAATEAGISFKYHGWGPYSLSKDRVGQVLNQLEEA